MGVFKKLLKFVLSIKRKFLIKKAEKKLKKANQLQRNIKKVLCIKFIEELKLIESESERYAYLYNLTKENPLFQEEQALFEESQNIENNLRFACHQLEEDFFKNQILPVNFLLDNHLEEKTLQIHWGIIAAFLDNCHKNKKNIRPSTIWNYFLSFSSHYGFHFSIYKTKDSTSILESKLYDLFLMDQKQRQICEKILTCLKETAFPTNYYEYYEYYG